MVWDANISDPLYFAPLACAKRWLQDRLTTASAKHSDLIAEVKLASRREFDESSGSRLL